MIIDFHTSGAGFPPGFPQESGDQEGFQVGRPKAQTFFYTPGSAIVTQSDSGATAPGRATDQYHADVSGQEGAPATRTSSAGPRAPGATLKMHCRTTRTVPPGASARKRPHSRPSASRTAGIGEVRQPCTM